MRRSRRRRRDQPEQVEACQFAPKAQEAHERRLCKCLSVLKFFRVSVSICRKNTITPARAVFFNRLGEIRDRSFEHQRYRASGLNLVTAAIVLWNTAYLERIAAALKENGVLRDDTLLQFLSPLGWEHINLTGDYRWRSSAKHAHAKFRPLRSLK